MLLAATNAGDLVLDPFFGSGTTGAVARRLGRHFHRRRARRGLRRGGAGAHRRRRALSRRSRSRRCRAGASEPRVAFASVVEAGLVKPGETLLDAQRRHRALIRADGALTLGPAIGSIHKIGALAQGLPACNGWTFWHVERAGKLVSIDDFRTVIRAAMREAAE